MESIMKDLHETCKYLTEDLQRCNEKIRKAGGELSAGEVEYLDKLTHAIKCVKTTIAMEEAKESGEDGYSRRGHSMAYGMSHHDGSYGGDESYADGSSYARGRRNAPRDSMGRYSGDEGRSYAEGMSHDYLDAGLSEIVNIARGKMVGLPPEEKRRRVQMITEELSK